MIKAKLNNGGLLFGLSKENLIRLEQGQPIVFNLKSMGLEDRDVVIMFGETEDKIYESILDLIDLDKTKIHFSTNKDNEKYDSK